MTVLTTNIQDGCGEKSRVEKLDLKGEIHWSLLLLLEVRMGLFKQNVTKLELIDCNNRQSMNSKISVGI